MKSKEITREKLNEMSREELVEAILLQQEKNARLEEKKQEMERKLDILTEQIRLSNTRTFGRSSEKDVLDGQIELAFNEAESVFVENTEEPSAGQLISAYTRRKKQKGKRAEDLSKFPVKVIEHTLDEEKLHKFFPDGYERFPDEVYSKLEYHPASFEVVEHHIAVYHGKADDSIIRAEHPKELLDGSIVTASLAAGIMNAKYVNAMPLYRLEKELERHELNLSRQTMANWMILLSERYLSLLWNRMKENLFTHHVIHADETPVLVNKDGRKAGAKSYMWVYRSNIYDDHPVILYDYHKTRNTDNLEKFLNGFRGKIVSDGYVSYHKLAAEFPKDITVCGCWAHMRRKFSDIVKSASGSDKKKLKFTLAGYGLSQISQIYHMDNKLRELSEDEIKRERDLTIRPMVEAFFAWAEEHRTEVTGGSNIGKALDYALNQRRYLMEFLQDPKVPLDNNAAEGAIRPFVIGKKNWVMIDTVHGASASAIIYSIAETAKANNLKPYQYFKHILEEIPKHMDETSLDFLDDLLPWSKILPEECRKTELTNTTNAAS